MFEPLLRTKFHPATPPSNLVSRPHLTSQLEAGSLRKLTLIAAPAGFGKTILVCEWIAAYKKSVAWFSLDKEDNELIRFWMYFISALQTIQPAIGEGAMDVLNDSQPAPIENILIALINEISSSTEDFFIVLDDYHHIETADVHAAFEFLLQHQPQNLHVIMTTRYDPPWSLHLLRSRQEMNELRQNELCFSVDETEALFNQTLKFNLSAEDIRALQTRTEGWVVGLQLAALSMEGDRDPSAFVKGFADSNRFVFEYLIEEVLRKQPPELQEFLLKTSILDYLTAPLCDAILERENSQEILEYLEHVHLFLIVLDDENRWYRYHHLFASLLQIKLEQSHIDETRLHHRASLWLQENNLAADALGHAFLADDVDLAIRIIEQNVLNLLETGRLAKLSSWLKLIPDGQDEGRPWLCIAKAWVAINLGKFDNINSWLDCAEQMLDKLQASTNSFEPPVQNVLNNVNHMRGHIALIHSTQNFYLGNFPAAITQSQKALEYLPEKDWLGTSQAWMNIAIGLQRLGRIREALESNRKAIAILESAQKIKSAYLSPYIIQAGILSTSGELRKAEAIYKGQIQAFQSAIIRSPITGIALSALSRIYRERNELDVALRYAEDGLEISRQWGHIDYVVSSYIDKAEILLAMGDFQGVFEMLETGKQKFDSFIWPPQLEILEVEMHLLSGDIDFANRWFQKRQFHPSEKIEYFQLGEYLVFARLLIAQSRHEESRKLLGRLRMVAESAGAIYSLIKIQTLQAVACYGLNLHQDALAALKQALMLGEGENFVRAIIDAGGSIAQMLSELRFDPQSSQVYVDKLIAEIPKINGKANVDLPPLIEPLSNRELEVLQLLDTSMTSNEVAEALFIAVSTVRVHIKHIYAKLGVGRRFEAIQRAKELRLI